MIDTDEVTRRIQSSEQIIFVKYGDGELSCMLGHQGENCDGDSYTQSLRIELIHALYIFINSNNTNIYVGKWHDERLLQHTLDLYNLGTPQLTRYHLIMNDNHFFNNSSMYNFLKTIQESSRKKIIVSNEKNIKMKYLFKADTYITVPPRNWFVDFNLFLEKVKSEICENCILFTAAGQGSKVLIANLLTEFPRITCLDIGSSFDFLCQKNKSRAWEHSYEDEYNYYKNLLPKDW
jgi:hypothetical protein